MNDVSRPQSLIGNDVFDCDGARIGRVGNVYVDDATHEPEWVTVRTGLFGMKESFVPLAGASARQDRITVEVSKDKVREAPRIDAENGHLSDAQGQGLYDHYGIGDTDLGLKHDDEPVVAGTVPSPRSARPVEAIIVPESVPETSDSSETSEGSEGETVGAGTASGPDGRHHSSESTPTRYRVSRTRTGTGRHRKDP